MLKRLSLALVAALLLSASLAAQGSLSNQVLQLLTRVNSWTATNTFADLRLAVGVPSSTTDRFYVDLLGNLYFNGQLVAGAGGGTVPHNLLSVTHADTLAAAVQRGAVVIGNATPAWSLLSIGAAGTVLSSNGTDVSWGTNGASLTNLNAANLTGTAAAINGSLITSLNASNLASGTVAIARLAGITTSQIASNAGITYGQLTLTGGIVNTDVSSSAAIAYSKLNLASSVLTTDIAAGTLLFNTFNQNSATSGQVPQWSGTAWVAHTLVAADVSGGGTVTSVALTTPGILSVSGSPVTTTGTLALTLATQTANFVWAGPTSGAATAPTFRAMVNGDLPLTGVTAGTYPKVTVNTAGVVTAAASQITLTTDVTGTLPRANGGTGVAVSGNNTVLVGSGSAWVAQTVPDCQGGALAFTQSTNLFSCVTSGGPGHNLLSATHLDTVAASPVRGDLITGNATPAWTRLAIGGAGTILQTNGTDASWGNTIARGSIVASTPWTFTQTWNNSGVAFSGLVESITNTASAAGSLLLNLTVGGTSQFSVDLAGNTNLLGDLRLTAVPLVRQLAPTIASGFGTSPAILSSNGTANFRVNVGTGGSATSGVITLPAATNGWNCQVVDFSTNIVTRETASSTTSVTVTAASAWSASDTLIFNCGAY